MIGEYRDICFAGHDDRELHRRGDGCPAPRGLARIAVEDYPRVSSRRPLTRRETAVLELVAQGLSNEDIGARQYYTAATVKTMVTRILRKLDVPNRAAAVDRGWRLGYLGRDAAGAERDGAAS